MNISTYNGVNHSCYTFQFCIVFSFGEEFFDDIFLKKIMCKKLLLLILCFFGEKNANAYQKE